MMGCSLFFILIGTFCWTHGSKVCHVEEECDYYGNDIKKISTSSAIECQKACAETTECVAFAYSVDCWLKKAVGTRSSFSNAWCGTCSDGAGEEHNAATPEPSEPEESTQGEEEPEPSVESETELDDSVGTPAPEEEHGDTPSPSEASGGEETTDGSTGTGETEPDAATETDLVAEVAARELDESSTVA